MDRLRRSSRLGRILLAVVMLAAGVGIGMGAMVAAQSSSTPYYACVNNSSGTIKMISAGGTCAQNEMRIEWNQRGEQGPQGIPGLAGQDGEDGSDGADGLDGINCWDLDEDRVANVSVEDTNDDGEVNVLDCRGEKGDAGTFSGTFSDGGYSISVTDAGVVIGSASGARITLNGSEAVVSGVVVKVEGSAQTQINGGFVTLGGGACGVTTTGDQVVMDESSTLYGTIYSGPTTVYAPC